MKIKPTTWLTGFLVLLLGLILFLSQKAYLLIPFTDNEGAFVFIGREMGRGAKLYTDLWDHKPPLLFLTSLLLQKIMILDEIRLRCFALVLHFLNALFLFKLARRLGMKSPGAWASAFFYAFLILPPLFQPWAVEADLLIEPLLILSFTAAFSENLFLQVLSGFLWGAAFFTKQSVVFLMPVYLGTEAFKSTAKSARWFLGAALMAVFVFLPFALDGRLSAFWGALVGFNHYYVEGGWNFFFNVKPFRDFEASWFRLFALTYGLPLLSFGFFFGGKSRNSGDQRTFLFLTLWLICAFVSCCVSGYFFSYYFIILIPPLSLALGHGLGKVWETRKIPGIVYFSGMALGVLALSLNVFSIHDRLFSMAQYATDRYEADKAVGMAIQSVAQPQDRLLCWASDPQIYAYSGLRASVKTPFINHLGLMPYEFTRARDNFLSAPPRFCVVDHSAQVLGVPEWLSGTLQSRYTKVKSLQSLDLYILLPKDTLK